MPEENASRHLRLWIWLLVLASAIVRIVGLTYESFWNDETFSGAATQIPSFSSLIAFAKADVHPPGHLIFGWLWGKTFGVSDFSLRLTSALAGVALVAVVFRLGKQLFDERAGFMSALLSAFLFQGIYYSQEFRAYMPMALMSALVATLILDLYPVKGPIKPASLWTYVGLAGCLIVDSYIHYFGLLFSLLSVCYLIWQSRKSKTTLLKALGIGAVLALAYLPWVPSMMAATGMHAHPVPPGLKDTVLFVNIFFGPGTILDVMAVGAIFVGLFIAFRTGEKDDLGKSVKFLLLWIFVPLSLAIFVSYVKVPVYTPRNLLIALAPAILLLGKALASLRPNWKSAVAITLTFLVAHHAIQLKTKGHFLSPKKQQIREATQFIVDRIKPDESVVAVDWDAVNIDYYLTQAGKHSQLVIVKSLFDDAPKDGKSFWLASAGLAAPPKEELETKFEILESATFNEASVFHLRRR